MNNLYRLVWSISEVPWNIRACNSFACICFLIFDFFSRKFRIAVFLLCSFSNCIGISHHSQIARLVWRPPSFDPTVSDAHFLQNLYNTWTSVRPPQSAAEERNLLQQTFYGLAVIFEISLRLYLFCPSICWLAASLLMHSFVYLQFWRFLSMFYVHYHTLLIPDTLLLSMPHLSMSLFLVHATLSYLCS